MSSIQATINFVAHMDHEQADKWAKETQKWLRVQNSIHIDDDSRLTVTVKSVVEPASINRQGCLHPNTELTPKNFEPEGLWCPDCRMVLVDVDDGA